MFAKIPIVIAVLFGLFQLGFQLELQALNNRPIIGVVLVETEDNQTQFVPTSYVKYLEMSGARVVSVFLLN